MNFLVVHADGRHDEAYPLDKLHLLPKQVKGLADAEQCVALTNETEWCLSYHATGDLLWENNLGDLMDTWYMSNVSEEKLLQLWMLLIESEIEKIKQEDWIKGDPIYGV